MNVGGSKQPGEKFDFNKNLKCKITAIIHSNYPTKSYGIIRAINTGDTDGCNAYIELKRVTPNALNELKNVMRSIGVKEDDLDNGDVVSYNSEFLASKLAISKNSDTAQTMIPMVCVILFIMLSVCPYQKKHVIWECWRLWVRQKHRKSVLFILKVL